MQMTDRLDQGLISPQVVQQSYQDLWRLVSKALFRTHVEGQLKVMLYCRHSQSSFQLVPSAHSPVCHAAETELLHGQGVQVPAADTERLKEMPCMLLLSLSQEIIC